MQAVQKRRSDQLSVQGWAAACAPPPAGAEGAFPLPSLPLPPYCLPYRSPHPFLPPAAVAAAPSFPRPLACSAYPSPLPPPPPLFPPPPLASPASSSAPPVLPPPSHPPPVLPPPSHPPPVLPPPSHPPPVLPPPSHPPPVLPPPSHPPPVLPSPFSSPSRPASPFSSPSRPASPFSSPSRPASPFSSPSRPASPFSSPSRPAFPLLIPLPSCLPLLIPLPSCLPLLIPLTLSSRPLPPISISPLLPLDTFRVTITPFPHSALPRHLPVGCIPSLRLHPSSLPRLLFLRLPRFPSDLSLRLLRLSPAIRALAAVQRAEQHVEALHFIHAMRLLAIHFRAVKEENIASFLMNSHPSKHETKSAESVLKPRMSGTLIGQELEPSLLVDVELHSPRDPDLHASQHAHQQQLGGKMEYNYLQARFAEPSLYRVKVYRLNDDGKWDDKGTGHVSVEYLERSDAIGLVVIDEEDNATLLVHRISTDDIYQRQEDTIISWTDPEVATDLALSFQESMGCAYIWDQICNVQRQIQLPSVLATEVAKDSSELPAVETRTLPAIAKLVTDVSPFHRDRMASLILREVIRSLPALLPPRLSSPFLHPSPPFSSIASLLFFFHSPNTYPHPVPLSSPFPSSQPTPLTPLLYPPSFPAPQPSPPHFIPQGYVQRLVALFRASEGAHDTPALHHLYRVFKGLVLLNDSQLLEQLFAPDAIMDVIGALEYDPDVASRQQHRASVQQQAVYREALPIPSTALLAKIHQTYRLGYIKSTRSTLPIPSAALLAKIHQTYRLGYIKDVILPRALDDQTFSSINSLILFNNVEVVTTLHGNKPFLGDLFARLRASDPHSPQFTDLVRFLQEFCALHKHLQLAQRTSFFSALIALGLFDVCTLVMQHPLHSVRLSGIDILMSLMVPDPAPLRTFLVEQPNHALLSCLVRGMVACRQAEGGLHAQLLEMLRVLLDPDTMDAADKSKFLDLFYEDYLQLLISAVVAGTSASQPSTFPAAARNSTGAMKKRRAAQGRADGGGSGRVDREAGRGAGGRGDNAEPAERDGTQGRQAERDGAQGRQAERDGAQGRQAERDGAQGRQAERDGAQGRQAERDGAQGRQAERDGAQGRQAERDGAQGRQAERDGAQGRQAERGGARGGGEQGGAEGEERRGQERGGGGGSEEAPSPDVLTSICDLLCFCVQHHSFRMKYYVLRNSVAEKVLRLTQRREKYLSVAAIRFLRCCVALKDDFYVCYLVRNRLLDPDDFYVRYLVKNRLLDPVMAAFRVNGARYNLLNSAVLELIDFVRKENVRPLVAYIVESYGSWLDCIDYVDSFKLLRLKYEQNLESNRPAVPPPVVILPPSTSHHHHHHHHHHPHQHHHQQQQQHPLSSPPASPPLPTAATAGMERHDNDAANDAATDTRARANVDAHAAPYSDADDATDAADAETRDAAGHVDNTNNDAADGGDDDGEEEEEEEDEDEDEEEEDVEAEGEGGSNDETNDADANGGETKDADANSRNVQRLPNLSGSAAGSALGVVPVGTCLAAVHPLSLCSFFTIAITLPLSDRHPHASPPFLPSAANPTATSDEDADNPESAPATVPGTHSPPLHPPHPSHLPIPLPSLHHPLRLHPHRLPPHQSLSPTARRPFSRSPSPPLGRPSSPPARPLSPSARHCMSRSPSPPPPLPPLPPINGTIGSESSRKRPRGCMDSCAPQAEAGADGRGESGREQGGESSGVAAEGGEPGPSSKALGRKRRSIEGRGVDEGEEAGGGTRKERRQLSVVVGEGDGEGAGEDQGDYGDGSPKGASPKGDSPKSGSPKAGSPKAGSPKAGSPKGAIPKGGSPKGGSPKGGSPKGDGRVGGVRSFGDASKKALCMRKRFLQVRTQDNTTAVPLGEVAPGGGPPKGSGGAQGREEPTLGVCSPRPVLCDPWRSARGKGRERAGSAEGGEGDGADGGGDDGEWAVRLAMAEEEEERRQADGADGDGNKGGGSEGARGGGGVEGECAGSEVACGDSDVGGKGGRDAEEGGDDMDGAGKGELEGQEEEKAHGENAGSGAMSLGDEAGGADARTAAAGGAQGAARSVFEALR
ncbi:unnamed protein product [Closterium sp. NIES-65]|nr:unnamed protein product [Closterium sp. NIES-65]